MRFFWRICLFEFILPLFALMATIGWPQVEGIFMTERQRFLKFDNLNGRIKSTINDLWLTPTKRKLLRSSLEKDPFETWLFKNRFQSKEDQLTFSPGLSRGVIEQKITTNGLKKIILRSLKGEDISIAIIGGSISAGGGLNQDKEDLRGIYYQIFANWWKKTVEPFTGSIAKVNNLAIGGTSSNFFAFCYKALLNPATDMDLVLLDFTVNDYVLLKDSKFPMALPLEQLTREILRDENSPSLIFVNFIQGQNKRPTCNNLENHGQTRIAENYGITSLSLRNFFCSSPPSEGFSEFFASDGIHPSILSHAQIASMIINYVRQTMLRVLDSLVIGDETVLVKPPWSSKDNKVDFSSCFQSFRDLPESVFEKNRVEFLDSPLCFTQITPDGTKNESLRQTLQVKEIGNFGFQAMEKVFINQPKQVNVDTIRDFDPHKRRTDAYGGWKAQSANSLLELEIIIPITPIPAKAKRCILKREHDLGRKVVIAIRTHKHGGNARVWLDEYEENGFLISTHSFFGRTKLHTIAWHVKPGRHVLSVRTETPGVFIISAVMAGPTNK